MDLEIKTVLTGVFNRYANKKSTDQESIKKCVKVMSHADEMLPTFTFERQGTFTVAMVNFMNKTYIGIAKKHPKDKNVPIRGQGLALSRAVHQIFKTFDPI